MNTAFLLMAQFETPIISIDKVAPLLGMSVAEANTQACKNKFPIPWFRAGESQKSPRLVHIEDLAKHLDKKREDGKTQWARNQL